METLSRLAIARPVTAWMALVAIVIFGAVAFLRMGSSVLPDVDYPVLTLQLSYPGAAPEVMESDVLDIVENAMVSVPGVRRMTSVARSGSATVTLEFDLHRSLDSAFADVQAELSVWQRRFPRGMDPISIMRTNAEDEPVLWLTLSSPTRSREELMRWARDFLFDRFSTLEGVGTVGNNGYVEPNLRLWLSTEKLRRYQLTAGDVSAALRQQHSEPPAGLVSDGGRELNVRVPGEATQPEEFAQMPILYRGGAASFRPVPLGAVARIERGLADVRRFSRANGELSLGVALYKQRGANAVDVAHRAIRRVDELRAELPAGIHLDVAYDNTRFVEGAVRDLNLTLLASVLLTALVCGLFFASGRAVFNVLLSIPTSILGTFIVLHFAGFTLNTFSLMALSLATGIVVDDAIMVMESILRHRRAGQDWRTSALVGTSEISFAALAASLSLVAIFLPVAFMSGLIGRFFFQFGVTMSAAVLFSYIEAITLTPMRCSRFPMRGTAAERSGRIERGIDRLSRLYRRTLALALDHRGAVLAGSVLLFVASLYPFQHLKKELTPVQDGGRFMIRLQMPPGTSLAETDRRLGEIEAFLARQPEVDRYQATAGGAEPNGGNIALTLKEKGRGGRTRTQQEIMDDFRRQLSSLRGVKLSFRDPSNSGFLPSRSYPIELLVQGRDWALLPGYAAALSERLEATGLVTDLDSDYRADQPELRLVPNRARANARGVAVATIAETVSTLVAGTVIGTYPDGAHRSDIRLKLVGADSGELPDLSSLFVRNNRDELVPLGAVVDIQRGMGVQSITRRDRERSIQLVANVAAGRSQAEALERAVAIGREVLPEGYRLVLSGNAQLFRDTFWSLWMALAVGILLSYLILASQLERVLDPLSILVALPFSVSGAIVALFLTGGSLNLYSLIGLILLMGIAKKNSILLVDCSNRLEASLGVRDALLEAGATRFRPILMTSIATVAGAIPPALLAGAGQEARMPMAIAVIGGVFVSTLLTLYAVPCAHAFLRSLQRRGARAPKGGASTAGAIGRRERLAAAQWED